MFTRKVKILALLLASVSLVAVGCAPKKNEKKKFGRLSRGTPSYDMRTGMPSAQSSSASWGTITGTDQNFYYSVMALAQVTDGSQLGNVSAQPTGGRGVYFWGDGLPSPNSSSFTSGRLHVEIWDDLAGQTGTDGQPIPPVAIHIGSDQQGFVGVSGGNYGGQITLTFQSQYDSITLTGTVQGQQFTGMFTFSNAMAQNLTLGQFAVPACGFFRCQ